MSGFSVRPEVLADAGASVARTAADVAGTAGVLRDALSQLGAAAAHPGIAAAADDAGVRWRGAIQAWALSGDGLGTSLVGAATTYLEVDARQVQRSPAP